MAKVSVECPGCFAKLNLADRSKLGKKIKCPKCAEVFVPEAPDDDDDDTEMLDEDDLPAKSSGGRKRPAAGGGKNKKPAKKSGGSGGGNKGLLIGGGIAGLLVIVVAGLYFGGVFSSPPATVAPPVAAAPKVEIPPTEKMLALRWMPADTELILHVKVADIWQAPLLKSLIDSPQTAKPVQDMQKYLGVGPADIESVTLGMSDFKGAQSAAMMASMGVPPAVNQFKGLMVARSKKPLSQSAILQASPELKSVDYNGKSYFLLPSPPGQPASEAGGWVADANTFVMGGLTELKSAMDKGETVTPRKELSFVDATPHIVLVVALKEIPPVGTPPSHIELQQALTESMQGFGLGINIRGGFDLQTSLLLKDAAGATKVKTGLEAAVVEGRKQFDVVKATAPPLLGDLGQMLIDNLKITEQSQVVKVTTSIPDSAQQKLEQSPLLLASLFMGPMMGGLNPLAGDPGSTSNSGDSLPGGGGFGGAEYPGETAATAPVRVEGLSDGLTLTAKTAWAYFALPLEDNREVLPLVFVLDVKGDALKKIVAYREVTTKSIVTDAGAPITVMDDDRVPNGLQSMKPVRQFMASEEITYSHPAKTMRIDFALNPPELSAKKIAQLEGTFQYLTSDSFDEFTIADAPKAALMPLSDPKLQAAGVKLVLSTEEFAGDDIPILKLSCNEGFFIGDTSITYPDKGSTEKFGIVEENGKPIWKTSGFEDALSFTGNEKIQFKLYRDVKEHAVSFRFENVPLPLPDSKPKEGGNGAVPDFGAGAFGSRKKPGETEPVDSVNAQGLPDGITLSAKTSWSEFPSFSPDGKQSHPIQLMLDAKGDGVNTICAFGQVTPKTMTLEGGGMLKTSKSVMMFGPDPLKSLVSFDFEDPLAFDHPKGTMRVTFSVEPPAATATKITALEGTFKYLTSEKSDEFAIVEAPKKALKPLADPELKAAGVKLLLAKGGGLGGETLTLSCGKGHFLGKVGMSNPDDANGVTQYFNSEVDKGQTVYRIQAFGQGGKFSEKMQVKFKLHRDVKEHTVSFRFENVPLPTPDSKPKGQTQ